MNINNIVEKFPFVEITSDNVSMRRDLFGIVANGQHFSRCTMTIRTDVDFPWELQTECDRIMKQIDGIISRGSEVGFVTNGKQHGALLSDIFIIVGGKCEKLVMSPSMRESLCNARCKIPGYQTPGPGPLNLPHAVRKWIIKTIRAMLLEPKE